MADATPQVATENEFQFKSTRASLNELILSCDDVQRLEPQLETHAARVPMLFSHMPVILNLQSLDQTPDEARVIELLELCRRLSLVPVGLKADPAAAPDLCRALQLADFSQQRSRPQATEVAAEPTPEPSTEPTPAQAPEAKPEPAEPLAARVITTPVRSGQQIYARGTDLIVLSAVSAGAEIIADGHIHVYGALRGRAMAGVNGNTEARIFCQSMEAELISIAGYFKTSEDLHSECWQQPTQALLRGSRLDTVSL